MADGHHVDCVLYQAHLLQVRIPLKLVPLANIYALDFRNGVLAHSALYHIWRAPELPPEVHPFILSLLERFELSFPIGPYIHKLGSYAQSLRPQLSSTGAASSSFSNLEAVTDEKEKELLYLIPTLLPEIRPAQLAGLWPRHTSTCDS